MTNKHLKTNNIWNLPQNKRIVAHWNDEYQPIGDGGVLLNRFLKSLARNFKTFPISHSTWKKIPKEHRIHTIRLSNLNINLNAFRRTLNLYK